MYVRVHEFSSSVCEWACVGRSVCVLFYVPSCAREVKRPRPVCLSAASPPGLRRGLEKLSEALPPCFVPSVRRSASVRPGQHKQRRCLREAQISPLPLKLPAPLFSCPNSTAIKLSWLEFRKQLSREKYRGVGGGLGDEGCMCVCLCVRVLSWTSQICAPADYLK